MQSTYVSQAVNDSKIIDLLAGLAVLVRGAESTIIGIEDMEFPFIKNLLGHLSGRFVKRHWTLTLDQHAQFAGLALILQFGRRAHQHIWTGFFLTVTPGLENL